MKREYLEYNAKKSSSEQSIQEMEIFHLFTQSDLDNMPEKEEKLTDFSFSKHRFSSLKICLTSRDVESKLQRLRKATETNPILAHVMTIKCTEDEL